MPKDIKSLEESRNIRNYLLSKWGRVPSSIWRVNWQIKVNDLSKSYNEFQQEQALKHGKVFSLSQAGTGKSGGISKFPQDICRFLIKFFTEENETVLDPFAGHNSRMESCYLSNRHYIGFDISEQFMEWNRQIKDKLYKENELSLSKFDATISLSTEDSRYLQLEPESVDFCITSPPFYDVEYYGDEPEQLGRNKLYTDFLYSLSKVIENCFNTLKKGKYIAWEVNDFRRNGIFHLYHYDIINLFQRAGFGIHDIIIVDYGSSFFKSFLSCVESDKTMPKQHSYIIIGKKQTTKSEPKRQQTRERLLIESNQETDNKQLNMF